MTSSTQEKVTTFKVLGVRSDVTPEQAGGLERGALRHLQKISVAVAFMMARAVPVAVISNGLKTGGFTGAQGTVSMYGRVGRLIIGGGGEGATAEYADTCQWLANHVTKDSVLAPMLEAVAHLSGEGTSKSPHRIVFNEDVPFAERMGEVERVASDIRLGKIEVPKAQRAAQPASEPDKPAESADGAVALDTDARRLAYALTLITACGARTEDTAGTPGELNTLALIMSTGITLARTYGVTVRELQDRSKALAAPAPVEPVKPGRKPRTTKQTPEVAAA